MDIIEEYQRQQSWRNWEKYLEAIPLDANNRVLDLGCSIGGVSNLFAQRVASVTGIDSNSDFINYCNANKQPNQNFICSDFATINYRELSPITGVWASFSLSYLKNPAEILVSLYDALEPGGWIALADVSCFISGNMLLDSKHYQRVRDFEIESLKLGLYDFDFGSKMESLLKQVGFNIIYVNNNVTDAELNFDGSCEHQILLNWKARLERMQGLKNRYPAQYPEICNEIIGSLESSKHCKGNNVRFVVATKT
ncbi:hypothetical protein GCM10011613_29970 [Cellvibrio zantedeschiae]|uniref:Methyltransferase domain-containing protein n=1 Tax=Cellvibrio zantedeschiae TaxID=1237077 RepID=A0ABQ3B906_9GAMM|nr:class I SAM-dependent methyltransferase [Cellvibrio zantedeschiae]GGY83114.1 hypothetical protein GCM10011613_29970 [Cellvibrio zantedeschiae]